MNQVVLSKDETRGTFLINSNSRIVLKSGVKISGEYNVDAYYKDESLFWDNCDNELGRSLFFANGKENIEILGEDGHIINGKGELWTGEEESKHRPSLIRFVNCKNVTLKNLNLANSACWCIHLQNCENVKVDGLVVKSSCNHNNDGIDIDCCRNVVVQNCVFDTGDDSIVIKSTKNLLSNNISVRNCKITSCGAGFKIGTETVGDITDVMFYDCEIIESEGGSIKLMTTDGANIKNVLIKNVKIVHGTGPLFIANGTRMRKYYEDQTRQRPGTIKNSKVQNMFADVYIREENFVCNGRGVVLITGTPNDLVENIDIIDSVFNMPGGEKSASKTYKVKELQGEYPEYYTLGTTPSYGAYVRHAKNVKFANVKFTLKNFDVRKCIHSEDVENLTVE